MSIREILSRSTRHRSISATPYSITYPPHITTPRQSGKKVGINHHSLFSFSFSLLAQYRHVLYKYTPPSTYLSLSVLISVAGYGRCLPNHETPLHCISIHPVLHTSISAHMSSHPISLEMEYPACTNLPIIITSSQIPAPNAMSKMQIPPLNKEKSVRLCSETIKCIRLHLDRPPTDRRPA